MRPVAFETLNQQAISCTAGAATTDHGVCFSQRRGNDSARVPVNIEMPSFIAGAVMSVTFPEHDTAGTTKRRQQHTDISKWRTS